MARGGVVEVDLELGKVVIIWEGIECTFMAKITGGIELISKVYLFKDRLYEEPKIPKKIFQQAGAIFASRKHRQKRLQELAQELKEAQVGIPMVVPTTQKREKKEEQLMLF